jgi:phosphoglycerate dehydrogenase-like enzyme
VTQRRVPDGALTVAYHGAAGPRQRERFVAVAARHDLDLVVIEPGDAAALAEVLPRLHVWWHILTPITAAHLDAAPALALVHKWGVGVNTIDVAAASQRGIATANMAGSNAVAVAEHALGLLLAVLRRTVTYHEATIAGSGWRVEPSVGESCGELSGRRVGLVGFGDIAQRLGAVLTALGAEVHHHSRCDDRPGWLPLDDLLATSDVVSLHLPLTEATAGLIDRRRLALLPDRAVIVNTARGGLLDLDALADELVAGRLGGAGLDVFPDEPFVAEHPIRHLDSVVATPHVAWLTWETLERSLGLALDAIAALRAGEAVPGRVG